MIKLKAYFAYFFDLFFKKQEIRLSIFAKVSISLKKSSDERVEIFIKAPIFLEMFLKILVIFK
jgi:hypothetical protein